MVTLRKEKTVNDKKVKIIDKIESKIDKNKQLKRQSLLETAFMLFTTKGIHKTSISDIVENAGVAKGTFYLYFKDKYDIRNFFLSERYHIIINILCKKGNKKMSTLPYSFFCIYFLMVTGLPATSH